MATEILSCYQNKRGDSYFELCAPDGEIIEIIFNSFGYEVDSRVVGYYKDALKTIVDAYYKKKEEEPTFNGDLYSFLCWYLRNNRLTTPFLVFPRNSIRKEIGAKIKSLRLQKGMEAKKLAACVGIDAAHLSRIEQGKISVGIDTLGKIANVLGCAIDLVPFNKPMWDPFMEYREKRIDNEPIVIKSGGFFYDK